jgi:hypothetical protein
VASKRRQWHVRARYRVPSFGFAASVLAEVRQAAPAPLRRRCPSHSSLVGLVAAAALAGFCFRLAPDLPVLHAAAAAFAGTYPLVRLTFVFTAPRR